MLKGFRLYGLLLWAYIATNSITHPQSLTLPLTHLASWPHEDTVGATSLALSLAAALVLAVGAV